MNSQPDRRLIGIRRFHAMATMRRDVDVAAGFQERGFRLVFEFEPGFPAQEQYPLGVRLVVPEAGRARLTG